MSRRMLKTVLVVSLSFNLAVVATVAVGYAIRENDSFSRPGEEGRVPIDDHGRQLSKSLGLSGEKAKCFEDVMARSSGEAAGIKSELQRERDDLFHLLQASSPDERAIMEKVGEISVLQGRLEKLLVKRLLDSRAVLEPEEDEKLLYLIRCSMRPGCIGKENCPYQKAKKAGE